jgi:uroporphyrinogen decarboxylase
MNSRERVLTVLEGGIPDRCPVDFQCTSQMAKVLVEELNLTNVEALRRYLGSDIRMVGPTGKRECIGGYYSHLFIRETGESTYLDNWGITWRRAPTPSGDVFYDVVDSPLKRATSVAEIEDHASPSPAEDWDFSGVRRQAAQHEGYAVAGSTAGVFDDAWRLLGFENMLMAMHTSPQIVEAVLRKVCDYWLEYARLTLEAAAGAIDLMWTRDDLGTQNGLMISRSTCRRFVIPLIKERVDLFHQYGARAIMHCCGGIAPIIEDLIGAGVEALNPIQSAARGMDRRQLKAEYGRSLVFHGSVDQQRVLVPGTPEDVVRDTQECIGVLGRGGGYIVASSHEIEADIPVENVKAMFLTAQEYGRYE